MRVEENSYFAGVLRAGTLVPSAGCVLDAHVGAGAAIGVNKLMHKYHKHWSQPKTAATSETRTLHVVLGATGTIVFFKAGSITAPVGDSTVTIDLQKAGVSILDAVITLDNANVARVLEAAVIDTAAVVADDWLEIVIVATVGTGTLPTGLHVQMEIDEDPQ